MRRVIEHKRVPEWDYPSVIAEPMKTLEESFELFRKEAWRSGRNLRACRRARTTLQGIRQKVIPNLRKALIVLNNQLDATRHGLSVEEWMTVKRAKEAAWREESRIKKAGGGA